MSQAVVKRLQAEFGERIAATLEFRGDSEATVKAAEWHVVATFLRNDPELHMDHFIDLTAVDFPDREPRFDLVLTVRSQRHNHRFRLRTRVQTDVASLTHVWLGADWAEREVWDMFGIKFTDHPDLRRILLYEQFEGHPLRKDYPIERAQPLVPYREGPNHKLPPFGVDQGQPWTRVAWGERLEGGDLHVSPAIAVQEGQSRTVSDSEVALREQEALERAQKASAAAPAPEGE